MGLKDIYFQLEDKWYNALDKIDAHIPIYKVVDKIDEIVPSFALFIAVIVLIALALAVPLLLAPMAQVTLIVEDEEGNLLPGVSLDYAVEGVVNSGTSNENGELTVSVPLNSTINVTVPETTVAGEEFERAERTFDVDEEPSVSFKVVLKKKAPPYVDRTILFQDASGQRVTGKMIKVRLSCQNPLVTPSPLEVPDLDMDGEIVVREPRDCGIFQATIIEPTEFRGKSYILDGYTNAIRLEAQELPKGSLRARIKDAKGTVLVATNFDVTLLDNDGIKISQRYSQNYGEVTFSDLTAGNYTVSVEDSAGQYGIATQPGITVSADETTAVDIIVSKTVKATLTVKAVDKGNGQRLADATVRLINSERETIAEKSTGSEAEDLVFTLTETGDYTLFAMHKDYLYEIVELQDVQTQSITIAMEKVTPQNSGRIEVKVIDEDNSPVKNARVKLRFLETGMLVPIEPKMTDFNGVARFAGVRPGSYYAYVEKFPAFGDNKEQGREIDIREVTHFTVRLIIGDALVKVRAVDEDMLPVAEAEAEFFSEMGESLGKIPLADGTGQLELKADKRIYVVVQHADYMAVQTMPTQLWPDKTMEFVALMEPRLILGAPKIQFEGIYNSSGQEVKQLNSGQRYLVTFKLSIPEEGDYEQGGFHFRVGDERLLVNDPLVVKEAIAGNIDAPLKGTSFTPPLGYDEDSGNITEGDAKWVNITWKDLKARNYYFGFEIRVKSQVTPYTRLPLHYRAWAIDSAGDYIRTPDDAELGTAESVGTKQALYAKTLDIAFLEGQASECLEDFCYSGESILDEDKGLYIYEPYEMRNGSPHKYTFSVLNNSERQYENSELYITVDGMTVSSYTIQNASAREISASGLATKKVEGIDLGAFTKGKSISAEIDFTPNALGWGSIEVKVIADARVVFLRTITATIVSEKDMLITLEPEHIPSYVATPLKITMVEAEQGYEVDEVLIRVLVTNPDKTELYFTAVTNGLGVATIDLPASEPNAIVRIEAEKPGYYAESVEITADSAVLVFDPDKVRTEMETRGLREQLITEIISNTTGIDIVIEDVGLTGRFEGLLDRQTMANYSKQFAGTKISGESSEIVQFFKVRLSENAEQLALANQTLKGEYVITATNRETGAIWDIIVPLEVAIKISGLPDNAPCVVITKQEWVTSTQGNRATIEFQVLNNCLTGGRPTALDSLQAKLSWNSDIMGQVEISLTDSDSGQTNSETLKPEMWTKIISGVKEEGTYYGMLTFTPMQGYLGEDAKFSVSIDGAIKTVAGEAFVGSTPKSIDASIRIINLEQCIQYPGAEDILDMTGDNASFTVDAAECGEVSIDVELCQGDPECRGGSQEGGITVTPTKFTLSGAKPVQDVTVARQSIPGMYGIHVSAKTPGRTYRKVALIDVLVVPDPNETFKLDKYAFTLVGAGSQDNTTVFNKDLAENVTVEASACDWGTAEEEGMFDLAGAGVGAAIAGILGAQHAIKAATGAAAALAQTYTTSVQGALDASATAGTYIDSAQTGLAVTENAVSVSQQIAVAAAFASTGTAQIAVTALLDTSLCPPVAPLVVTVEPAMTAATTSIGAANTKATATSLTQMALTVANATAMADTYSDATDTIKNAQATAATKSTASVATDASNSVDPLKQALEMQNSAIESASKGSEALTATQAANTTILAELETVETELGIAQGVMDGLEASCQGVVAASCAIPEPTLSKAVCAACAACVVQTPIAIIAVGNAQKDVGTAISVATAAQANIGLSLIDLALASAQMAAGQPPLQAAIGAMTKMGGIMAATGAASTFNTGRFLGIMGTSAALGAVAGGLLGGVFGDDPCDEMVSGTLVDYVMNLKEDNLPIDVENPLIAAFWSTDDAKVNGTWEDQEVGIYFENLGLEETDATYSVVTLLATRHYHANPTRISKGNSNFAPFNVPDQMTDTYTQRFHLKFTTSPATKKVELLPQETYSCLQGTLFGETGEQALPKVKLSWDWSSDAGIAADSCDYDNDEGIYCDATQFSIALSKKMQRLREFMEVNQFIECPTNPAITELEEITAAFHAELAELGLDPLQLYYPGCWVPMSTILWDGTPAIMYYVEEADAAGGINWTSNVPDQEALKELILFRARLQKDGYSSDFQSDFADFYATKSFYNAPDNFTSDGSGKWADYFKDTERLRFKQRFVENTSLPDAGIYDVLVNAGFESGAWEFFDSFGSPDATIVVELLYLDQAYPNSVFYYLPFNGNVGNDSTNGRNGYGIGYFNVKNPIAIATQPELVDTKEIYGSNPEAEARVEIVEDFKTLNSVASKRGFLLELEGAEIASKKNVYFYPNYATPVMMKMSSSATDEPFSAFYEVRQGTTPVEAGTTLSFWTGAGQCLDFSGSPVYEAFRFKPDREAHDLDAISNWQFAYAVDWDKAQYGGDVYLKSVIYSPLGGSYKLKALAPKDLLFMTPNTTQAQTVDLQGIQGMRHNNGASGDVVSEIQEIFDLVEDEVVCVTDTGQKTSFWWNPKTLNDTPGSRASISALESSLSAGSSCIGYGS